MRDVGAASPYRLFEIKNKINTPPIAKGIAILDSNLFEVEFQICSPLSEAFFFENKMNN